MSEEWYKQFINVIENPIEKDEETPKPEEKPKHRPIHRLDRDVPSKTKPTHFDKTVVTKDTKDDIFVVGKKLEAFFAKNGVFCGKTENFRMHFSS